MTKIGPVRQLHKSQYQCISKLLASIKGPLVKHRPEQTCHDIESELNIFDDRSTSTSTMAPFSSEIWSRWSNVRNNARFLAIFTSRRTDVSAMFKNCTWDGAAIGWCSIVWSNDIWKAWITYRHTYDKKITVNRSCHTSCLTLSSQHNGRKVWATGCKYCPPFTTIDDTSGEIKIMTLTPRLQQLWSDWSVWGG